MRKLPRYELAVAVGANGASESLTLTAKGEELSADEIVRLARRSGIPVVEDANLALWLAELEIGSAIPRRLFAALKIILKHLKIR